MAIVSGKGPDFHTEKYNLIGRHNVDNKDRVRLARSGKARSQSQSRRTEPSLNGRCLHKAVTQVAVAETWPGSFAAAARSQEAAGSVVCARGAPRLRAARRAGADGRVSMPARGAGR